MDKKVTFSISVLCIVLNIFLVLFSIMLPILAPVLMVLSSATVSYCLVKCGNVATFLAALFSALTAFVCGGFRYEMILISLFGLLPGIVSGIAIKKNWEYYIQLCASIVVFMGVLVFSLYFLGWSSGTNLSEIFDDFGNMVEASLIQLTEETVNASFHQELMAESEINDFVASFIDLMRMIFPSVIIIFSMIMGYFHTVFLKIAMKKFDGGKMNYTAFDSFCTPKSMVYVYITATLLLMLNIGGNSFSVILNNIIMILDFVIAFCGLSFIENVFKQKLKYKFIRWILYGIVLIVLNGLAMQLLSIVGMIDSFIDYRRIKRLGE